MAIAPQVANLVFITLRVMLFFVLITLRVMLFFVLITLRVMPFLAAERAKNRVDCSDGQ